MLLDGTKISKYLKLEIKDEVRGIVGDNSPIPSLAVLQIGEDEASSTYVKMKKRSGSDTGILVTHFKLDKDRELHDIVSTIERLNLAIDCHGIIVQLPLPERLREHEQYILDCISPLKDVDCLGTVNQGLLAVGEPRFKPCTPQGVMDLLDFYNIDIEGKDILVIGRSNIVGRPMAKLLEQANATVTLAHSKSVNIGDKVLASDIVVVAVGKENFVDLEMLKRSYTYKTSREACVELLRDKVFIDIGINVNKDGKMKGDIDFKYFEDRIKAITPVPGGVGRMTTYALMKNVLKAYKIQNNIKL